MDYYVISPNIYNDGDDYSALMFDKQIAAVGWTEKKPKGIQFKSIKKGDCIIVAKRDNWEWKYYYMGIVDGDEEKVSIGRLSKKLSPIIKLEGINLNFENWSANGSSQIPSPQRIDKHKEENIKIIKIIDNKLKEAYMNEEINNYINLLLHTHNLILHGAPGTGKTYLAQQIAKGMGCTDREIGFVQFHPSYDYTDFVEGLRPIKDIECEGIGFERKNGVFKEFCEDALKNLRDSQKKIEELHADDIFERVYNELLNDVEDGIITSYHTTKGDCDVFLSDSNQLTFSQKSDRRKYVRKDYLKALFNDVKDENIDLLNISREKLDERVAKTTNIFHVDYIQYRWALHQLVTKYKNLSDLDKNNEINKVERKNYVFIIDEINRGEISKIFGELFFSIDPGYRGEKGKIKTQYQNLIEKGQYFEEGFFIPENVFIIGTMNDIDRSVESMDFAFRRRFTFVEIKANDNLEMLDNLDTSIHDEAIRKLLSLNNAITRTEGLSSAYHIGGAYFLKLKELDNDFEKLWEYHLEGLLREYLRGMEDLDKLLENLHNSFENPSEV